MVASVDLYFDHGGPTSNLAHVHIGDEMFFGQDRVQFVAERLSGFA